MSWSSSAAASWVVGSNIEQTTLDSHSCAYLPQGEQWCHQIWVLKLKLCGRQFSDLYFWPSSAICYWNPHLCWFTPSELATEHSEQFLRGINGHTRIRWIGGSTETIFFLGVTVGGGWQVCPIIKHPETAFSVKCSRHYLLLMTGVLCMANGRCMIFQTQTPDKQMP